ncbi:MAG: iron-containing alcohol dehydrogenase [Limisphaerales bacterium]
MSKLLPKNEQDQTALVPFDSQPRTRLIFGMNSVERLGDLARELGAKKVLLVTDAGIVKAGHAERVRNILESAKIKIILFDQVRENPTTNDVDACLQTAKKSDLNAIMGLGGGSAMDTAKGCNFLLTNGGRMEDYCGIGKAKKEMLPLIAIPTTAGTGSECQSFALIADGQTHQKMACGDPKAAAKIALLDPSLTLSQPRSVAACTGIDALAHALETAVTKKRNSLSLLYSREAFKLLLENFPRVLRNPTDLAARGNMLLGAAWAGTAIENSMLGAAHAAANPLTAHFGIVHGEAVGMMLPHVIQFNAESPTVKKMYAELADDSDVLVDKLKLFLKLAEMSGGLAAYGIKHSKLPMLAEEAARQWTVQFNPRPVAQADFVKLYEAAFE